MKTIAILSQKGGTGKTTLALHLAVAAQQAGLLSAVLDLDPQASASGWKESRNAAGPAVSSIGASRLDEALHAAAASGIAFMVLDTAPHSNDAAVSAAEAADLILIPCRAGILDLRAIGATARLARGAGKPAFAVLNQAPHRAPRIVADVAEAVKHYDLSIAPVVLHRRSAYAHALTAGQTAAEYEPGGKADGEVRALLQWVRDRLDAA